jgi:NTF2 fold immunity protein
METNIANGPKRRRRWFQFSLRSLMIGVTLLAIVCGATTSVVRDWLRLIRERDDAMQKEAYTSRRLDALSAEFHEVAVRFNDLKLGLEARNGEPPLHPKDGYVPDADTAIKIAVAAWEPVYGKDHIAAEKPYRAHLVNGVWTVEGSLTNGWVGGVAIAEITKQDGKIIRVSHGK